jgi:hypothetical protein
LWKSDFFLDNPPNPGSLAQDMETQIFIPSSLRLAGKEMHAALAAELEKLSKVEFLKAWSSLFYLFPGLHPDGFDDTESEWPRPLRKFAAEAWRRADAGEISDDELYPSDAQWCGLYDRMLTHNDLEVEHRLELAGR